MVYCIRNSGFSSSEFNLDPHIKLIQLLHKRRSWKINKVKEVHWYVLCTVVLHLTECSTQADLFLQFNVPI